MLDSPENYTLQAKLERCQDIAHLPGKQKVPGSNPGGAVLTFSEASSETRGLKAWTCKSRNN